MWRLFSSIWRALFGGPAPGAGTSATSAAVTSPSENAALYPVETKTEPVASSATTLPEASAPVTPQARPPRKPKDQQKPPRLTKFRYQRTRQKRKSLLDGLRRNPEVVAASPYRFALPYVVSTGKYLDLSQDADPEKLNRWELPLLRTPQDLADWLQLPLGKVAWLSHRFSEAGRPVDESKAHYRYHWKPKRAGGYRLIEAPLPTLQQVQEQIHDEILSQIPVHTAAHGFCCERSVLTNAAPHVGQAVVVKLDLDNFYTRVRYSRVVALFRGIGYSREVALWLARLVTSAIPGNLVFPGGDPKALRLFLPRHLPQGAPTSPALANLVAYSLDIRLAGLARSFGAQYTRYGDDMTFSGDESFQSSLRVFLPLVRQIVRQERFRLHRKKRQILRRCHCQQVTGVVVNDRTNISRSEFDRLKAILHNCIRFGPAQQNRQDHPDFRAHLRGKIAFVQQLNRNKGEKLLRLFQQITW